MSDSVGTSRAKCKKQCVVKMIGFGAKVGSIVDHIAANKSLFDSIPMFPIFVCIFSR